METSMSDEALEKLVGYYDSFVDAVDAGHQEARERRRYVLNQQWTEEEKAVLRRRRQPIITDNRIKRKTDYFLGIERQTRTDPRCFPRTPDDEDAAEAFTDAIRFVCDNSEWDVERSECFDYLIVEGIEGAITVAEQTPRDVEIKTRHIPWDRIIYDPHSRDRFFEDAKYKGIVTWMDKEDAYDMFEGKEDVIDGSFNDSEDEIFDDRPNRVIWVDKTRNRLKVIQLYYLEKGVWMHSVYTKQGYLIDPQESPYEDEYGRPDCPIELAGAYIDEDNDRFGLVQDMISLQDMINKLTSKFMHFSQSERTWGNKKAGDPNKLKRESKKPDGHFELEGDATFGEDFGIVNMDNKSNNVFLLLQQVQSSMEGIGGSSVVEGSESGRSKEITAQAKQIELGAVLDAHRQFSKRVYRQQLNRIRQFWSDEKWVRVTDDERNLKFVKLNQQVTYKDLMVERFGEDWAQMPELQRYVNDPQLDQVAEVRNNPSEIDIDIIIEESPDIINLQQEQFAVLAELAKAYGAQVPFEEMVRLSSLRNKNDFIERTKGDEQTRQANAQKAAELQQMAQQLQMAGEQAKIKKDESQAALNMAKAENAMADSEKKDAETDKTVLEAEAQEINNELTVATAGG